MLEKTVNYLCKKVSERVREKIENKKMTLYEIYPRDDKLLSRIQNNKRTKKNPYLVTDIVMEAYDLDGKKIGLIPKLEFKNEQEILWGTESEIRKNLFYIFSNIIEDILTEKLELGLDVNEILSDYVPYAMNNTYWEILFENKNPYPAISYGILEDDIICNRSKIQQEAIFYLFQKSKHEFEEAFLKFTKNVISYTKIDKVIYRRFIILMFVPILKKYIPDETSLGLRVKNLILGDLQFVPLLVYDAPLKECCKRYKRGLNNASANYILQLEKIQKEFICEYYDIP